MIPREYVLGVLAVITVIGILSTTYWYIDNESCTVTRRTTVQETGETMVVNETIQGGIAPVICSAEDPDSLLLGAAGPTLTAAGLWFGVRFLIFG